MTAPPFHRASILVAFTLATGLSSVASAQSASETTTTQQIDQSLKNALADVRSGATGEGIEELRSLARDGNQDARYHLGRVLAQNGNPSEALSVLKPVVDEVPMAARIAGRIHLSDAAGGSDPAAAVDVLRSAAESGHPAAQVRQAAALLKRDADGDRVDALKWLIVAEGHYRAQLAILRDNLDQLPRIFGEMTEQQLADARRFRENRFAEMTESERQNEERSLQVRIGRIQALRQRVEKRLSEARLGKARRDAGAWLTDSI